MSAAEAYLDAAGRAVTLLGHPGVAEAWERPSALAEMTVGGLAGHLAYQIFSVGPALEEPTVHLDDLTVSVGLPARELPDAVFDPVLTLLARLAVRRHGQAAVLRALTRTERAPAAINAI